MLSAGSSRTDLCMELIIGSKLTNKLMERIKGCSADLQKYTRVNSYLFPMSLATKIMLHSHHLFEIIFLKVSLELKVARKSHRLVKE